MEKILVVSSSPKETDILLKLIPHITESNIDFADCGGKARRKFIENGYDVVIINMPLSDEDGLMLAQDIAVRTDAGIILLAPYDKSDYIESIVGSAGVFVVSKPFSEQMIIQAIKFNIASRSRMHQIVKQKNELKRTIDDLKAVSRAKCCLVQYLNMTESQAHRYIEKQAMDMRCSRRRIADKIISTYEM